MLLHNNLFTRRLLAVLLIGLFIIPLCLPSPVLGMTGSGTSGDPYIISDVTDLQDMCNGAPYADDAYYELGNDIDATATQTWNWDAGRSVYAGYLPRLLDEGHFDGNGYIISGLHIDRYNAGGLTVGLFSSITGSGVSVTNVYIIGAYVKGEILHDNASCDVGILAGQITLGTVDSVYTTGEVVGEADDTGGAGISMLYVGGLSGRISGNVMEVTECASIADVSGTTSNDADCQVGGFTGTYYSEASGAIVRDCYARGDVDGSEPGGAAEVGGFAGRITGGESDSDNCYSTGAVTGGDINSMGGLVGVKSGGSTCTNSFWDTEASGLGGSDCGTGGTTAEMQTQSTFTDAGWDFSTVWGIRASSYPYLLWMEYDWTPILGDAENVLWFQPITIISGTTLPDRAGTAQNGAITWGTNPAGIAITMGPLISVDQGTTPATPDDPDLAPIPDMIGETGQPGWTTDCSALATHPFYPVVDMVSSNTNIPECTVWILGATAILLVIMAVSFKYAPHQIFTAIAGGGWASFCYAMGIYPFWVIFIFAVMAIAIAIGERSPTVS